MNQPAQEHKFKVSNPERILRILQKLCAAKLQVVIRPPELATLSIRGKASDLTLEKMIRGIRLAGISDKGMETLVGSKVQVEFVMMSTKVVFNSVILRRELNSIIVQLPQVLVSIERRKNTRYQTTEEMTGFVSLGIWKSKERDPLSPPAFDHLVRLSNMISLADVSTNGLCGIFRFPAPLSALKTGVVDDAAQIHLPMQEPIIIPMEVRWVKRIKENIEVPGGKPRVVRTFRFGCEFRNAPEAALLRIKHFIHQMTQQGAI